MRFLVGMFFGFLLWCFVWFVIPDGILPFGSWHYEGDQIVIDDFFGSIGKVIGFFALPIIGGIAAKNENNF